MAAAPRRPESPARPGAFRVRITQSKPVRLEYQFFTLFNGNRAAQAEVSSRAQYVQQTAQLEPLYREMVKALADLSVRNNDVQLREMLAKQGITLSANPPAAAAPAPEPRKGGK